MTENVYDDIHVSMCMRMIQGCVRMLCVCVSESEKNYLKERVEVCLREKECVRECV